MSEAIAAAAAHQQQQQLEKQVEEGSATDVTQANGHTSNWVVGFDSQRKTQYFYNVVTGASVRIHSWRLLSHSLFPSLVAFFVCLHCFSFFFLNMAEKRL